MLGPKEKLEAINAWAKTEPEREKHRSLRTIWKIEPEEEDIYNNRLAAAIENTHHRLYRRWRP